MPQPKAQATVEVEPEIWEWFKAQGDYCQRYIAAALRIDFGCADGCFCPLCQLKEIL